MMAVATRMRRLAVSAAALALVALAYWAPPAAATFHEMSIREVYAGSAAHPDSEYVELQMWAAGQNLVGGHSIAIYNAGGGLAGAVTFAGDVPQGANQSTIVAATPAAESEFGIVADTGMTPGLLDAAGGAVCWASVDCVSWGSFSGSLSSPPGSPAGAIPDGMALRRTIAPGCPTLLEPTDDHDNSAADFSPVFPAPRPNSVPPPQHACGPPRSPSGSGKGGAPQTRLKRRPPKRTHDRTPTFRFTSSEAGSTFQCKLDGKPYRRCHSPFTTRRLSLGPHVFRVRARDASGKLDPSPASYAFKVISKR